jgi:hypothetical protein
MKTVNTLVKLLSSSISGRFKAEPDTYIHTNIHTSYTHTYSFTDPSFAQVGLNV